jgi:SAM-dependent methyltransferase
MAWWQTYFDDDYLRMYGPALTSERSDRETEGVIALLDLPPGAMILDLCCGQGRHSVRLAQSGYRVFGLDYSETLLSEARRVAAEAGVDVHFAQGDMREIPWRERFDAVINLFTAFGYFAEESQNQRVLDGICRALKPGGKFLIEITHCDWLMPVFQARDWRDIDGTLVWEERRFDPVAGTNTSTRWWRTDEGMRSHSHTVRIYTATELRAMIREAGLVPVAYHGGLDGSDFRRDSQRLVILAERQTS